MPDGAQGDHRNERRAREARELARAGPTRCERSGETHEGMRDGAGARGAGTTVGWAELGRERGAQVPGGRLRTAWRRLSSLGFCGAAAATSFRRIRWGGRLPHPLPSQDGGRDMVGRVSYDSDEAEGFVLLSCHFTTCLWPFCLFVVPEGCRRALPSGHPQPRVYRFLRGRCRRHSNCFY